MEFEMKEGLKGTTTVGIVCKEGVVLASESRATMGTFIATHEAQKVYQIDDCVGMTTAGGVGDAQHLVRLISAEIRLNKMRTKRGLSVKAISTLLANILSGSKYYPYFVQLIVGGFDSSGPAIYSLDLLGGQIEERKMVSTGSGSPTAYGVLDDRYKEGLSLEEGVRLAVRAINSAMRRDAASGDNIEVVKITKDGLETLSREEIESLTKEVNA